MKSKARTLLGKFHQSNPLKAGIRREALRAYLTSRGIGCEVHYPVPDHLQPVREGPGQFHLPVTEAACAEVLSLPCYPGLEPAQQDRVVATVRDFFAEAGAC